MSLLQVLFLLLQMKSALETHLLHNNLSCVVRLCVGKETTVELRNEAFVTGRVIEVKKLTGSNSTTVRVLVLIVEVLFRWTAS